MLARRRDLRLLVGAGLVSETGDRAIAIGIPYAVYALTGSTIATAGMLLTLYGPSILLSSLAGVFVDRWNRKTTMVAANLLLGAGLAPLLFVHGAEDLWLVFAATTWEGIVVNFFVPAEQALLPRLVDDDELTTANALNGQMREVARLVGSALGGVLVAAGGIHAVALADMATFAGAALLVARIRTDGRPEGAEPRLAAGRAASRLRELAREWSSGLSAAVSNRALRAVLIFTLLAMTGEGVMGALFAPFVRDVLHGGGGVFGIVNAVQAIGGIAGGTLAAAVGRRTSAVIMFGAGSVLFGLVDLTMFLLPLAYVAVWPAVVCMILVGLPGAVTMTGYATVLQRATRDAYRGRVFGALGAAQGIAILAGTLGGGLVAEPLGVLPVISVQGVAYVVAGVVVLAMLRPRPPAPVCDDAHVG